jgi:DNA polymerase
MPNIIFWDVETRSSINLKVAGAHRYASDPATEVLCVGYAVDDGPVEILVPGQPIPQPFIEAARDPSYLIVAHNDAFERTIERLILHPRYGWPLVPIERRRCSMAMAMAAALPGALDKACEAIGLTYTKDKAGQGLMRRMAKPLPGGGCIEDAASLERLYTYCRRDVEAGRALFHALPPLTEGEQRLWALDAAINSRGFFTDGALLDAAHKVVTEAEAALQAEFGEITGLDSTNQTAKLIAWLAGRDCIVTDVQKGTLRHALRRKGLASYVRRAIELRLQLAHASAAKVEALRAWRGADGRVRGALQYHGAATGRWVGRGPQPQNFRRDAEGTEEKIAAIMSGAAGLASPVEAVGDIARAMICAAPGHRLLIGDFSGIESRVLAWAAGEQRKLEQWARFDRTGDPNDDPYVINGRSFGHPEDTARAYGKIGDLAFGYQGGIGAWQNFAPEGDASDEATIKRYRDAWRAQHPKTVQFWYDLDRAAIRAVRHPGAGRQVGRLQLRFERPFLSITLPGGRPLRYPFPRIETNRFGHPCVMFKDNAGGKWTDCSFGRGAYGGLWAENIVSGIARDLLAAALQRLEAAGYPIVLHVHDEIVVEVPNGFGSPERFRSLLIALPDWAEGLPMAAKVREAPRFSKPDAESSVAPEPATEFRADEIEAPKLEDSAAADDDDDPLAEILDDDVACNAGGVQRGGSGGGADAGRLPWTAAGVTEVPPGSAEFEAILASVSEEDCTILWPPKPNGGYVPGNGHGRRADGKVCCPFHDDSTPSLQIYNDGDDPHYHCYGCGRHGPLTDLPEVLIAAASSSAPREQADDAATLAYAHQLWRQAHPITGTLAERYLAEVRGINIDALSPDIATVLRFHPACPFNGSRHPCLLALFRDVETNEGAGIHRIALTPDAQKIDRRMLGRWPRPRAIKLWPLVREGVFGPFYLGEGIETVLAAATRLRDRGRLMWPAWAAGSSGSIAKFPVLAGLELVLLVDRDQSGEEAAAACSRNWKAAGQRVRRLRPQDPSLNDFNDLIRAKLRVVS